MLVDWGKKTIVNICVQRVYREGIESAFHSANLIVVVNGVNAEVDFGRKKLYRFAHLTGISRAVAVDSTRPEV
jgi:hypothetical protein